jgi:Zn-dependent protease
VSLSRELIFAFGIINVFLATFNLLPIPPLDGSAVIERFLPARWWPGWLRLRQYSFAILFLFIFLFPGVLDRLFEESSELWGRLWGASFT